MKFLVCIGVLTGMLTVMGSSEESAVDVQVSLNPTYDVIDRNSRDKRSPLDLSRNRDRARSDNSRSTSYSYNSDTTKVNATSQWVANPLVYTIGGVLSGSRGVEEYFTQVLRVSRNYDFS